MTDEHFDVEHSLMLLTTTPDIVDKINIEDIVNKWSILKLRRINVKTN